MSRPWLLGALFASLALNVFIGGAFAGAHLAKTKEPPARAEGFRGRGGGGPMMAAVRALPPQAQAAWREGGEEFARTQGAKGREARQLARQSMASIASDPFDPQATLAALKRARTMEYENRLAMDERLVTFAASLPADQRKAFGEALSRPMRREGGDDRRGGERR